MNYDTLALLAGTISTVLFAAGNVPMLVKALRTRDLSSYSPANLTLTNLGNIIHWVYILSLPFGPIWLLHSFYTVTALAMLVLYLRYRRQQVHQTTRRSSNPAVFQTQEMYSV
ncbi:MAG: hypothetical protein K8J31_14250 [Anaerolineae bacterium]|nr:hypothetical protein [Anaerolineae bacterium]